MSSDLLLDLLRIYVPILVDGWQRSARTVTTCSAAVEIGTVSLSCTGTPAIDAIGLACAACRDTAAASTAARRHGPLALTAKRTHLRDRRRRARRQACRWYEGRRSWPVSRVAEELAVVSGVSGGKDSAAKSLLCAHNGGVELPQRDVSPTVYSLPRPCGGRVAQHGARSLDVAR